MAYKTNISNTTERRRAQIRALQDEFTTFSWGGVNAWDAFGAFIINENKGSLKFYNGPGFSNEYTKPQFDSGGGHLQGVNFSKQTISFTIGVYWFSIEEYRKLLNWLSPMKIDYLTFGFDSKYRYDVKLSKIGDSTRWIVGKENGEPRYYTELSLTFEVQGEPCAKGVHPYEFKGSNGSVNWDFSRIDADRPNVALGVATLYKEDSTSFVKSDLETPIRVSFKINLAQDITESNYFDNENSFVAIGEFVDDSLELNTLASQFSDSGDEILLITSLENLPTKYLINLSVKYSYVDEENKQQLQQYNLIEMVLQNLTFFREEGKSLQFTYHSETGLVFLSTTDENPSLLSLQTYSDTNDFLVETLHTNKFMLPGEFQFENFYENGEISFELTFEKQRLEGTEWAVKTINSNVYNQPINIECYPRTNII